MPRPSKLLRPMPFQWARPSWRRRASQGWHLRRDHWGILFKTFMASMVVSESLEANENSFYILIWEYIYRLSRHNHFADIPSPSISQFHFLSLKFVCRSPWMFQELVRAQPLYTSMHLQDGRAIGERGVNAPAIEHELKFNFRIHAVGIPTVVKQNAEQVHRQKLFFNSVDFGVWVVWIFNSRRSLTSLKSNWVALVPLARPNSWLS